MQQAEGTRYRATVQYDGSAFSGWQVQPGLRTVQGELERSLIRLGIRSRVMAAGRTDAGVHATGQEVAFDSGRPWESEELTRALASVAPDDVWVQRVRPTEPGFHPRFRATARRYEYYVVPGPLGRSPLRRRHAWWSDRQLDVDRMISVARQLVGEADFGSFAKSGQPEIGTRCTIESAEWARTSLGDLRFTIVADRFLHRMVRYLVSVLVDIGSGRREEAEITRLLQSRDDVRPPEPAPPGGLYLTGVRYHDGWNQAAGVPGLVPPHEIEAGGAHGA